MLNDRSSPEVGWKKWTPQWVVNGGLGLTEAARRLSISVKTLVNWVAAAKHGTPVKAGVTREPVTELEAENSQMKRALAEMKMERDLLKKAALLI